jgi:hypothetical protein
VNPRRDIETPEIWSVNRDHPSKVYHLVQGLGGISALGRKLPNQSILLITKDYGRG